MHQQNLKENLFDERLMYLLMCESMYHQPDKEKSDPSTKVLHACLIFTIVYQHLYSTN